MKVKLQNGRTIEVDGDTQGKWGPPQICPQCGQRVWRIRHDRNGDIKTHLDQYGNRGECTGRSK